jgi:hypothetical protein
VGPRESLGGVGGGAVADEALHVEEDGLPGDPDRLRRGGWVKGS